MKLGKHFFLFILHKFSSKLGVGSCLTSYFYLIMQITSYENKAFWRASYLYTVCMLTFKVKFQKKYAHLYTRINGFVCNILDLEKIHPSNSVLRSGGGGGGEWECTFFWKIYVTLSFAYLTTK